MIGHHYIGIRSSTKEVDDLLRRVLGAYLVPGVQAPPNYSLRIGGPRRVGTELSQVYRSGTLIARTRSAGGAVMALLHELCRHQPEDPQGLLRADVAVLVTATGAVLAPKPLRHLLVEAGTRVEAWGARLQHVPFARIDPATAEVVLDGPTLDLDPEPLAAMEPTNGVAIGRGHSPIVGWAFFGSENADVSPARAAALAAATLLNASQVGKQAALDTVAAVFDRAAPAVLSAGEAPDMLAALFPGPVGR